MHLANAVNLLQQCLRTALLARSNAHCPKYEQNTFSTGLLLILGLGYLKSRFPTLPYFI
ncbi:hypothetical protein KM92DES2_20312 [uncultured Desulfovibrio sp.]|uniref:Uncharacterized protein n=1 Tax=uncultured Desulfovibrio sp. TaxID=167968 RepID=A0A212KK93_9BACT|nr:hypothetical protein KM92DES2_20312 [uncultured Desulfovibrio sp.]